MFARAYLLGVHVGIALTGLTLVAAGCDHDDGDHHGDHDMAEELDCVDEDRATPYMVGLTASGELFDISFVNATPAPPAKTENSWRVAITDRATGTPIEGATIDVIPMMPDHGHGTTKDAVVTPVADAPGQYDLAPVLLHMAGYWVITLDVTAADARNDKAMFRLCVEN